MSCCRSIIRTALLIVMPATAAFGGDLVTVRFGEQETCQVRDVTTTEIDTDTKNFTPADAVAFRLDFDRWMNGLTSRYRAIGESLLVGDRPGQVATRFSLSPSMISKLRWKFRQSWERLQNAVPASFRAAEAAA